MASSTPVPSQGDMFIPVSEPQKEILNINEVAEDLLNKLQEDGILIESSSLHTDRIQVIQGDPVRGRECLASVICSYSVSFTPTEESEILASLTNLQRKFSSKFALHLSQGGRAEVAFLPSIKHEVLSVLDDLKYGKKLIPIPRYLAKFLKCRLPRFTAEVNSNFHSPVDLDVIVGPSNEPHLQIRCQRIQLPEAVRVVEVKLNLLCLRRVELPLSRAGFLQSSQGKKLVKDIEGRQRCTMDVETKNENILLVMKSPQGHQIEICQGDLAASTCPVIVLPLSEGQQEWQASYECILQRGCLNCNVTHYLTRIGLPPRPLTLRLQCQELAAGQTVIIMYVPARTQGSFNNMVSSGVTEAVKHANDARSALALPLKLIADTNFNIVHCMLTAVCDCYDNHSLPSVIKFYLDFDAEWIGDIGSFFQTRGWTTESPTDSEDVIFDQRVKVVTGDILNIEADAVVNSTDKNLEHKYGQVSKVFLAHLGEDLLQQCRQRYHGGIGDHVVAATEAFGLSQFKYIFHIALPVTQWNARQSQKLLGSLKSRVEACLCLASIKGLNSIAFPALATGNLRYPPDVEAKTVLGATREFFRHMPHSSLQKVLFIAYKKNPAVARVFKAEETVQRYSLHRKIDPGKVDRRFEVRKVLVQVIRGDARTRYCTAQLLLCANPPSAGTLEEYRKKMRPDCNMAIVDRSDVKNDLRENLKIATAASVQINMQTFEADQVDNIVSSLDGVNVQTVQIIVIVVPSSDVFLRLCRKLARTYSVMRSTSESRDKIYASVGICGSMKDTKETVNMVLSTAVPDKYVQAEQYNLHPSFLETRPAGVQGASNQTHPEAAAVPSSSTGASASAQQAEQSVTVTLPRQHLRGIDMDNLVDAFEALRVSVSFRGGNVRFRTVQGTFEQLTACVRNTLAGIPTRSPYAAPPVHADGHQVPQSAAPQLGAVATGDAVTGGGGDLSGSGAFLSLGSPQIPSEILAQQPTSSKDFDKNIAQDGSGDKSGRLGSDQSVPGPGSQQPVDGSVFSFLGTGGDVAQGSPMPQVLARSVSQASNVSGMRAGAGQATGTGVMTQKQFITKEGLKVLVYTGDITKAQVDAVVNAAHRELTHQGGVASAIANAAGSALRDEGNNYITENGPLPVMGVVVTTAGALPCQKVLHAVGPWWGDYRDKERCRRDLVSTVLNCLQKADSLGFTSIALCSISSGICGVPEEVCAKSYLEAVLAFEEARGSSKTLQDIHFVDINNHMISIIQTTFSSHWRTELSGYVASANLSGAFS